MTSWLNRLRPLEDREAKGPDNDSDADDEGDEDESDPTLGGFIVPDNVEDETSEDRPVLRKNRRKRSDGDGDESGPPKTMRRVVAPSSDVTPSKEALEPGTQETARTDADSDSDGSIVDIIAPHRIDATCRAKGCRRKAWSDRDGCCKFCTPPPEQEEDEGASRKKGKEDKAREAFEDFGISWPGGVDLDEDGDILEEDPGWKVIDDRRPVTEWSMTISVKGSHIPEVVVKRVIDFMNAAAERFYFGIELGERVRHRHLQGVVAFRARKTVDFPKQLGKLIRMTIGVPVPGLYMTTKALESTQDFLTMIGYCSKDLGEEHFRAFMKGVSAEDIEIGRKQYGAYRASFMDGRIVIKKTTIFLLAHQFANGHMAALNPTFLATMAAMMMTKEYVVSHDLASGVPLNEARCEAYWRLIRGGAEEARFDTKDIAAALFGEGKGAGRDAALYGQPQDSNPLMGMTIEQIRAANKVAAALLDGTNELIGAQREAARAQAIKEVMSAHE